MAFQSIFKVLKKRCYQNILVENRKKLALTKEGDLCDWFRSIKPKIVILSYSKVGGIKANYNPNEFLLENIKIQINVIENPWINKLIIRDFCFQEADEFIQNLLFCGEMMNMLYQKKMTLLPNLKNHPNTT